MFIFRAASLGSYDRAVRKHLIAEATLHSGKGFFLRKRSADPVSDGLTGESEKSSSPQ